MEEKIITPENAQPEKKKKILSCIQPSGIPTLGNYLGARYAIKGGSRKIWLVMFFVLGLLFLKTILSLTGVIDF